MTEKVLAAIDWRIRIYGDGTIELCEKASVDTTGFDPIEQDVLEPTITVPSALRRNWDISIRPRSFDRRSGTGYLDRENKRWREIQAACYTGRFRSILRR